MVEAALHLPNHSWCPQAALSASWYDSAAQPHEQSAVLTPISQVIKLRPRDIPTRSRSPSQGGIRTPTHRSPYRPASRCWESPDGPAHTSQVGAVRGACPRPCTGDPPVQRHHPNLLLCTAAAAPRSAASGPHARLQTSDPDRRPPLPSDCTRCTIPLPPAAHVPRTPDAGAAGSPSGGGLLPRSPSRVAPPAPEAASAMANTGQVRG